MKSHALGSAVCLLLLTGCVSVPKDAGFGDVQSEVTKRIGQKIEWDGRTADDQAVDAKIRAMLWRELTANQAVQIALLNNRHLQATFEDLGIAQADLVQAGLLKNPIFDLGVRIPDRAPPRTYLDIAVVEDFLDVAMLPARKELAADAFEQAKARVTGEAISLAADTSSAFYAYQAAQQSVEFHKTIAQAAAASFDAVKKLHDAGNLNDLEFATQRAENARAQIELTDAQADADDTRERLTDFMGVNSDVQWKAVSRLPDLPATEIEVRGLEDSAVRQRTDLAIAREQVAIQARTLGLTSQFRFFQSAELGPEAERETDGQWRIGPKLSIPLPIFDQGQASTAKAQAQLRQSEQSLIAMELDARSQVRTARKHLLSARAKAILYRDEILPTQQEVLRQTQLQYNGMFVGIFQLLQAKRDQIEASSQYIQTLREYWTARVELERAVGGRLPDVVNSQTTRDKS